VALGADVGFGLAVGVGERVAGGGADAGPAEGPVTGVAEGDASWVELQPPIKPTIPNATSSVVSFICLIAGSPL
jgi:hypothetical protein